MIDSAMSWIEIDSVPEAGADLIVNQVSCLSRYTLANVMIVDSVKEYTSKFKSVMANGYGLPCNFINTNKSTSQHNSGKDTSNHR